MKSLRNSKGFTLIELMIVVVIIGILAAIAIPKFSSVSQSAKEAEAPGVLKQMRSLALSYYQQNDSWATSLTSLTGWSDPSAKYYTFAIQNSGATGEAKANSGNGTNAKVATFCVDFAGGTISSKATAATCP
ncbi:MAG TPA: prepilin-type N-terminal cleavage/methylation domain-containing protein [Longimicrobiaceae bacterium]|nr:prepilin-type N-terminal cleavage/methylation domain-containing protein [Longimicrobiaceae bacterium]